jgi:hypothetical protein
MSETFACPDCDKEYNSLSGMKYHLKKGSDTCSGHECPECDADWYFKRSGLELHYGREHEGTLVSRGIECETCGGPINKNRSQVERSDKHYCSRECHKKDRGSDVTLECEICGDTFKTIPSNKDTRRTCSYECQGELFSQEYVGEDAATWNGGKIELECSVCGGTFQSSPGEADRRETCSRDCRKVYISETYSGENSHEWKGGSVDYYGPNWRQRRDEIVERDGHTCQICGVTTAELGEELHVHHITPFRKFEEEHGRPDCYEKANDPSNLVSLCRGCHVRWEGIPLVPV